MDPNAQAETDRILPNSFLAEFESHFDEVEAGEIEMATEFRQLEEWTSMQSLIVIAGLDAEFGVMITAEQLFQSKTVGDLYRILLQKLGCS